MTDKKKHNKKKSDNTSKTETSTKFYPILNPLTNNEALPANSLFNALSNKLSDLTSTNFIRIKYKDLSLNKRNRHSTSTVYQTPSMKLSTDPNKGSNKSQAQESCTRSKI